MTLYKVLQSQQKIPIPPMPSLSALPQAPAFPPGQREPQLPRAYGAPLGTHRYPPIPGDINSTYTAPKNQIIRTSINIASLNVNGYAAPASNMNGVKKWSTINQTMSKNKIAILAVQETHLDAKLSMNINNCFRKKLMVLNSELPETPHALAGVAFILNKTLIQAKDITTTELIKGRALALKMKWHKNKEILLLNIYAPNNKNEHWAFWEEVDEKRRAKNLRHPDFMLGDFNLTEEEIDRSPPHLDDTRAIEALRNLRQCMDMQDTWRHQFPHERCFTY
jgi:exonuclease III